MQNAQGEHSAILSTFIKLQFVIKTFLVCLFLSGHLRQVLLYIKIENLLWFNTCFVNHMK